ncbi:unnamed protein product [Rotaria magnacalcarata]|uniref:G-protein coupled receptors family 1 profile domain-containing protein n=1 Tax=Rotaria magnacalcarata TaxID=392030 RepID=A0A814X8E9_9BILA|nr:unnamed protein product [Rotaria magnacalcarata]CAF1474632.1 unnamed protein product [Rotaria magnacalcarata]CAF2051159.1 unnamed protein product [Rotaria magnacalcarata]CAF3884960.1 unnamed protein product [Rotaria magnacalcarata]CAF4146743.1 unnamed protein product [Rotaria magnacalcarata]
MDKSCTVVYWKPSTINALEPSLAISIIASIMHVLFWIQVLSFSSLRQQNLIWLYEYIVFNGLLLVRFFLLYGIRRGETCLFPTATNIICYFEASSKAYINTIQNYFLLAFTMSRYLRIVCNQNIYKEKIRVIILLHFLIYTMSGLNIIVQFLTGWTDIWRTPGRSCDILYESVMIQIFNLFIMYVIPVIMNIIILALGIIHVSSTYGIRSEQIISIRHRRQRKLLWQTISFYSVWFILWSPNTLVFQFTDDTSTFAIYTSLLCYLEIALDPLIIAIIDLRFLMSWRKIWKKIHRQQRRIGTIS